MILFPRAKLALPLLAAVLTLGACAHAGGDASAPADFSEVATLPAPPKSALYTDCIVQAATGRDYRLADDGDTQLIVFHCTGAPAQAFFAGLGPRSQAIGSEHLVDGRTLRSTEVVQRNLFGVDRCLSGGETTECFINLNVGEFVTEP